MTPRPLAFALLAASALSVAQTPTQPELGHRIVPLLQVDGLTFKDMNRNGKLDGYEDWRLSPEQRAADLISQMTLDELAGTLLHGTLPASGPMGAIGRGDGYDLTAVRQKMNERHVTTFITRLNAPAATLAAQSNQVQQLAEAGRLGIPALISTDPRHHFDSILGASQASSTFSRWPETLGFAAIGDPALTRRFADVARQEYVAVGFRETLSPQADLATEPRWARIDGTFGEDALTSKAQTEAYVEGFQNGATGVHVGSVVAVVKHWAGYGAAKDGWDSHNYYGRYASFSGNNFPLHLIPFEGAFAAHVGAVMPTYSILQGAMLNGKAMDAVGGGYNRPLLQLLRQKYGFTGVVLSDWAITNNCGPHCINGAPAGSQPQVQDIAMSWGMIDRSEEDRFAATINAGVDQIGGTEALAPILAAVHDGKLTEARVREAATRILLQKFQLGIFEQPYVDEAAATKIAANTDFVREGRAAQARAVVLLANKAVGRKPLLPIRSAGKKVYLFGVDAAAASAAGFTVVDTPQAADLAIIRAAAPYQTEHPGYFFGSRQHEGRLHFVDTDPGYAALLRVGNVPTVFVTSLERPLILTNVQPHATALLGDFGIEDGPLLALLTGAMQPQGKLPFELPSSEAAVAAQKSDLPHDSAHPLYAYGFGLRYASVPSR